MLLVPIFIRNGSKTGFSFCAFPLLLPWLFPSEIAEPIWHCLLQWETRALWNFGHCAHMGKGHALRIVTSFFTATPKFISIYLPHIQHSSCHTDFIGTQKNVTHKPHKTLLLPDVQMHAGPTRKINRGLKTPRYEVAQQLFQPTRKR